MEIINDTCYLSLEDDGIENNIDIRKIVIPEGINTIGVGYITNIPNLEVIEFPSTLNMIWKSAITGCPKLTMSGLKFKNNSFYMQDINCICPSNDSTVMQNYVSKMIDIFYNDKTSFVEKCNIYNQILFTMNEKEQLEFSKLFINEVMKNKDVLSIIMNKMLNGEILNSADLQIYSTCIQLMMKLSVQPMIINYTNTKVACARLDNIVDVGYSSLLSQARKKVPDKKDTILINTFMLYAIIHEFQHIRQRKNSENVDFESNDLLPQLDFVDSKIQYTSDSFESGYGYSGFHDLSPDEIRADLDAYDVLISIINAFDNKECSAKMLEFIEERKLKRIRDAHQIDESGNIAIYDYRLNAFEGLLSRSYLSTNERDKLNQLKNLYSSILDKANGLGIDLFSNEIDYYKSKSNRSIVK